MSPDVHADLPDGAYAAALAGLHRMTVHRLSVLLRHHPPHEAWAVAAGHCAPRGLAVRVLATEGLAATWRTAAALRSPAAVWQRCLDLGLQVLVQGRAGHPVLFADDPAPPPVLFAKGDLDLLHGRRAAVVGTRNATVAGRQTARSLGGGLAAAGVHVVSGLARGIDGAAHLGVLGAEAEGRPIGVVASGLDVVYPREHGDLWQAVASCGLLLSEAPPGTPPEPYRFPLRNRIVAAVSEVVVVVESRERGGSLITVAEALDRGVPVMAVPGSPGTRSSHGTNALLRDGAAPACDADDVLMALHLQPLGGRLAVPERRRRPDDADLAYYWALEGGPATLDGVMSATGRPLGAVALGLARLQVAGWVCEVDGWFERTGAPL